MGASAALPLQDRWLLAMMHLFAVPQEPLSSPIAFTSTTTLYTSGITAFRYCRSRRSHQRIDLFRLMVDLFDMAKPFWHRSSALLNSALKQPKIIFVCQSYFIRRPCCSSAILHFHLCTPEYKQSIGCGLFSNKQNISDWALI